MSQFNLRWIVLTIMAVLVVNAGSVIADAAETQPPPPDGAVRMNESRIKTVASGNTWIFENANGGAYFNPAGTLSVEWMGKSDTGHWVMKNNEICLEVESWGDIICFRYYSRGAEVVTYSALYSKYITMSWQRGKKY